MATATEYYDGTTTTSTSPATLCNTLDFVTESFMSMRSAVATTLFLQGASNDDRDNNSYSGLPAAAVVPSPDDYDANVWCMRLCLGAAFLCWVTSSLSGNHSQVDKLWSIMPVAYAWICVPGGDARTLVMACVATVWGARLTYNFYRRGGYDGTFPYLWQGDEDYRWLVLKGQTPYTLPYLSWLAKPVWFQVFNIIFISIYQHLLLLAIASPSLVAWNVAVHCEHPAASPFALGLLDYVATALVLLFIAVEAMADRQQFTFQQQKKLAAAEYYLLKKSRKQATNEMNSVSVRDASASQLQSDDGHGQQFVNAGFCRTGLFSIVRKPNYAAEQAIWMSYYVFSISALQQHADKNSIANWSLCGCMQLLLLFQGSGWVTEVVSKQKYDPAYTRYQQEVPLYLPSLRRMTCLVGHTSGKKKQE
jgi:steroid 5-alpha reductase family enzyme